MARSWLICIPLFAYSDRSTDVYAMRNPIRDSYEAIKATANTSALAPAINTRLLQRRDAIRRREMLLRKRRLSILVCCNVALHDRCDRLVENAANARYYVISLLNSTPYRAAGGRGFAEIIRRDFHFGRRRAYRWCAIAQ